MNIAGMKDCVEVYAQKRGISKVQAEAEFKTAVDVITEKCKDGGVSFKGLFTIKKKVKKGRSGNINGKAYATEDKNSLSISVGSVLDAELNQ